MQNQSSGSSNSFGKVIGVVKSYATIAAKTGTTIAQKGLIVSRDTLHSTADKLGIKDKVK